MSNLIFYEITKSFCS